MFQITGRELATSRKIAIKKLKVGQFKGGFAEVCFILATHADLQSRWSGHVCYPRSQILTGIAASERHRGKS